MTKLLFFLFAVTLHAQWFNYPSPRTPHTKDGKPDLTAKTPRLAGHPDLSGVWQIQPVPGEVVRMLGSVRGEAVVGDDPATFSKYFFNILADFKPENAPIRPEAVARMKQIPKNYETPDQRCLPVGIPRAELIGYPFKIVQSSDELVLLYEADNTRRQIYTDGRKLPADPDPTWLGYSVARWEADTLVTDTTGFNDQFQIDAFRHPHSDQLHIHERFHRLDFGHMELQITVDDPKMYTQPITFKVIEALMPDSDVLELFCNENEKDRAHIK